MTRLLAVFKNREQTDPCLGYVLILVSSSPALSIKSLVALHDAFFKNFFESIRAVYRVTETKLASRFNPEQLLICCQ